MKLYQTKNLLEAAQFPTQIDFEQILSFRRPHYNNYYLKNLEAGQMGEDFLVEAFEKHGQKDWLAIRNLWLHHYGKFESDLIVLNNLGAHFFEVKNYEGTFLYEKNDCILNGRTLSDNCITQAKRNFRKVKSIVQEVSPTLNVYGSIVFIGENNSVEINSEVTDISVIRRNELKQFITKMAQDESYHRRKINANPLLSQFNKYEDTNPFIPKPIDEATFNLLRKGIHCAKCKSFNLTIKKFSIHCGCGFVENREIGILRTICEYGVLHFDKKVFQSDLMAFLNYQASNKYLTRILKKHFKMHRKNRYTYYEIDRIPFHKIQNRIKL